MSTSSSQDLCHACVSIFAPHSYTWWREWCSTWRATPAAEKRTRDEQPRLWPGVGDECADISAFPKCHHESEQGFLNAVAHNCWLCTWLNTHRVERPKHHEFETNNRYRLQWIENEGFFVLDFFDTQTLFVDRVTSGEDYFDISYESKSQSSTGCSDILVLARKWIADCDANHTCLQRADKTWYPTRLLDIETDEVRLIETETESSLSGPYATLSHCWGTRPFLVLSSTTLQEFRSGLSSSRLPRTFREAIGVVRKLGIRYMWIDSYCIIQGTDEMSKQDWQREVSKMQDVYSHSVLNVGSAHSTTPYNGLFSDRRPSSAQSCLIRWQPWKGCSWNRYILWCRKHPSYPPQVRDPQIEAFAEMAECTIAQRSWVVQEMVLSPRMISFTDKQVFWQCTEAALCEDFPSQKCKSLGWTEEHAFWSLVDPTILLQSTGSDATSIDDLQFTYRSSDTRHIRLSLEYTWLSVLENYRRTSLTYPNKDIFSALDGIGRRVATLAKCRYAHGVLSDMLLHTLLWTSDSAESLIPGVPSWHWASMTVSRGMIHSLSTPTTFYENGVLGERPAKAIPLAWAFLSANCLPVTEDPTETADFWPKLMCFARLLTGQLHSPSKYQFEFVAEGSLKLEIYLDTDRIKHARQHINKNVYFLPLFARQSRGVGARWEQVNGLLLCKTEYSMYQRIGTVVAFQQAILTRIPRQHVQFLILI